MRIFKYRYFHRWARSVGLTDNQLTKAIEEIEQGLHDGDLGGYAYKKRIGLNGRGKRGGVRSIVLYFKGKRAFFIYGYAKNVQADMSFDEKLTCRHLARTYFNLEAPIEELLKKGELIEVIYEKKEIGNAQKAGI